ncbi:hypothetical protein AGIG_G16339 [Arapaima gigas]
MGVTSGQQCVTQSALTQPTQGHKDRLRDSSLKAVMMFKLTACLHFYCKKGSIRCRDIPRAQWHDALAQWTAVIEQGLADRRVEPDPQQVKQHSLLQVLLHQHNEAAERKCQVNTKFTHFHFHTLVAARKSSVPYCL